MRTSTIWRDIYPRSLYNFWFGLVFISFVFLCDPRYSVFLFHFIYRVTCRFPINPLLFEICSFNSKENVLIRLYLYHGVWWNYTTLYKKSRLIKRYETKVWIVGRLIMNSRVQIVVLFSMIGIVTLIIHVYCKYQGKLYII